MTTTYRVSFTEILSGGRRVQQDAMVRGDLTAVQDHLDRTAWIIESVAVTEYIGSDATGRPVPLDEWYQG